jgi:hypothetical protein
MRTLPSLGLGLVSLALAAQASAGSHLWRFSEFYSSPDKQIQFIEMKEIGGSNNETAIQNHWYKTDSFNEDLSELLGSPLPFGTADKKFLVGTVSYAALPGVPAPDYVLPDGFLEPSGDTVHWWTYQVMDIPPATMPSDGVTSLHVVDPTIPALGFTTGPNSPTNFAGVTGNVVLPEPPPVQLPATSAWGAAAVIALCAVGSWVLVSRPSRAS